MICQKNIYRGTYQTALQPTATDGIVFLDNSDASYRLRYLHTVKLIRRGKLKQMNGGFMRICGISFVNKTYRD